MKYSKILSSLTFILILAVLIAACKKDRIQTPPLDEPDPLNEYSSVNQYFDTKKQAEQEFVIDTPGSGPLICNQGTAIWPYVNCITFQNGDSVSLPFTLKVVELYTPKDMIYYQMPTLASGKIMQTDGEVRIRAFSGSSELVLRPNCFWQVEMPNNAPKTFMEVFYGFNTNDWTNNPTSLGVITSLDRKFATTANSYLDSIARLGWINCGFTIGTGTGHTLTFSSTVDNLTNVAIFIYFPNNGGLMQVFNQSSGLIPDGSNVKIILIAVDASGNLFSYNETRTVTGSSSIGVTLSAITDADLTAFLDAL